MRGLSAPGSPAGARRRLAGTRNAWLEPGSFGPSALSFAGEAFKLPISAGDVSIGGLSLGAVGAFAAKVLPGVFAAWILGTLGCVPDAGDPFVPKYESERLKIGTSFGDALCRGYLELWERHIDILEETLGASREFAWLFLYAQDETELITSDCGWDPSTPVSGCWRSPVARAKLEVVPHELVHAWAATVQPRALPSLTEGLAARMDGTVPRRGSAPFTEDDLLRERFTSPYYPRAGHFVAWLMATHGADAFMALYARATRGVTRAEVSDAFAETLGEPLDDVMRAYETSGRQYYPAMGGAACGQGLVAPWRGEAATWSAEGSCEEGPWIGFVDGLWWQRVTIEVPSAGTYVLDTGRRLASLTRCLTEPADESELPPLPALATGDWLHGLPSDDLLDVFGYGDEDWADEELELEAGTYEVRIERKSREFAPFDDEMSLRRL